MKQSIKAILPKPALNFARKIKDQIDFIKFDRCTPNSENLRALDYIILDKIFTDDQIYERWQSDHDEIAAFYGRDENAGGVNPGDRRALYYLIMGIKPKNVLEVGTHIGASTLYIAKALKRLAGDRCVTSVDIVDVNHPQTGPWKRAGLRYSPKGFAEALECREYVAFHSEPCLQLMKTTKQRYDFIFLDGDHSARSVYYEVHAALSLLNKEGVILLHDYYPEAKALYPDGNIINGPYSAMQRITQENSNIKVLPLANLPWPTKQGTNRTSLALVVKV